MISQYLFQSSWYRQIILVYIPLLILGALLQISRPVEHSFIKAPNDTVSSNKFMDMYIPCNSNEVTRTGGFCISKEKIREYWLDVQMCKAVEDLIQYNSIVDLGAGLGYYGKCYLRRKDFIYGNCNKTYIRRMGDLLQKPQVIKSWDGYDGAINVEYFSHGFVKQQDLSVDKMWLGRTWDWVVSLEVGEHVPPQYEDIFIDNLIRHGCKGIILSWGLEKQGGHFHVNGQSNDYIKQKCINRGLVNDIEAEEKIRSKASKLWFKGSLMVFRYPDDYKCESAP